MTKVFLTLRAFELKQTGVNTPEKEIMAEQYALKGESRTDFGKGAARKLRAKGFVPGVIYGHGEAPRHVSLPGHDLTLLVRHKNVIIDLDIDGKSELVLVKDVQKDHVRQVLEHVDLVIVKKGEKGIVIIAPMSISANSTKMRAFMSTASTKSAASMAQPAPARARRSSEAANWIIVTSSENNGPQKILGLSLIVFPASAARR